MSENLLIVAVLEYYGMGEILLRPGWQSVRCPYHDDDTASASLNTDEGAFKCHGCGTKGDALGLIMSQEDIPDRAGAEQWASEELGISDTDLRKRARPSGSVPGRENDLPSGRPKVPSRGR